VIVSGAYAYALILAIDAAYPAYYNVYLLCHTRIKAVVLKYRISTHLVPLGLIVAIGWCLVLYRAKNKGLFINHTALMTKVLGEFSIFDLVLISTGILIFFAIVFSYWLRHKNISVLLKIIFIAPLALVAIQLLRQKFAPNQSLSTLTLMASLAFIAGVSVAFAKTNLLQLFEVVYQKTAGVLAITRARR
jgi:hypothetical protein